MNGTIAIPGLGPTKKVYVIAGVGVLGGVLVYAYWKRSQTAAEVAAVPAVVDSSGADGYTEDSSAAGYNTVYSGGSYSPYGYDIYGNPLPAPTGAGSGGVYTTNADWATAAETALESDTQSLSVVTLALSRVLGGLSVNSAQRDIFMQAVGLLGQPPQGYPTPIKLTDSGTGPTTPPAGPLPAPTGLKATSVGASTATLTWNKVTGAAGYRVYDDHSSYNVGGSIDNKIVVGDLDHGATYHFHVRALDAKGTLGASSASLTVRTKK